MSVLPSVTPGWRVATSRAGLLLLLAALIAVGAIVAHWRHAPAGAVVPSFSSVRTLHHGMDVRGLAFSPDGRILATSGLVRDATRERRAEVRVVVWDARSGQRIGELRDAELICGFSADGSHLATQAEDLRVILWDTRIWTPSRPVAAAGPGYDYYPRPIAALSPDGKRLALATRTSSAGMAVLTLWDTGAGRLLSRLGEVTDLHGFSPDGSLLACSTSFYGWSFDGLQIIEVSTGQEHLLGADFIAFAPDGRTAATGRKDGSITVWDTRTWRPVRRWVGHTGGVLELAFSSNSRLLATGGGEGAVRLWDTETAHQLAQWDRCGPNVGFSPDGEVLALAQEGEVHLLKAGGRLKER